MDTQPTDPLFDPAFAILAPPTQLWPILFTSPHSGRHYPPSFLSQSALDPQTLRRSEDSYVDELFVGAPAKGAPFLQALFPRAYLDVNREQYELDPAMFDGPLPDFVQRDSPRVIAGLGTIARQVASGAEIYRHKLSFAEAERRIETLYRPYHRALEQLVSVTLARFSRCLLLDCHSMPSIGGPDDSDSGFERVDFVLGDCFGRSCAASLTDAVEQFLLEHGYRVVRNSPYAGGFTTRHYGNPAGAVHAMQIEINRRLYMNESNHRRHAGFARLQKQMTQLIERLTTLSGSRGFP